MQKMHTSGVLNDTQAWVKRRKQTPKLTPWSSTGTVSLKYIVWGLPNALTHA